MTSRRSDPESAFAAFKQERAALNEKLLSSGESLDSWFSKQPMPPRLAGLAELELVLKARRDLLAELIALDDRFMEYLLELRAGFEGDGGSPPDRQ